MNPHKYCIINIGTNRRRWNPPHSELWKIFMFTIQLAGQPYTIDNHYDYIEKMCRDYYCEEPGLPVSVTEEEILREQTGEVPHSPRYLETLAVYRRIAGLALDRDTLLFHGSAVAVDGKVYLFTASSGTGKSTHTRLWREFFGSRAVMINDDKIMIDGRK